MATRLYGISLGEELGVYVTEGVGSATAADNVEITIDLAVITTKEQALKAIERIEYHIATNPWPPA